MKRNLSFLIAVCLGANIACLGAPATQDTQEQAPNNQNAWDFRIGFPLWAPGIHGTVGVDHREVHIDEDFWHLLDTLDFLSTLNLEIRKDRFLFFEDGMYLKSSTSGEPRGLFSGATVDVNMKTTFHDLALGYALVKTECFSVEPFAGAQLAWVNPDLTLQLPVADRSASTSKFWADPIVGSYLHWFSKPVGLYVKGDAGGFGVNAKLTWQIEGGLDLPFAKHGYARLAYRYLSTDYEKGRLLADFSVSGPQLEVGVRF
jgi:hypothetical protein